ncbi:MAG: isoleucine--tRNA ligase [Pseudomonadota bacterium]
MFKEVKSKVSFSEMDERLLDYWDKNSTFQKSLDKTKNSKPFIFYDGPPFATGLPHYGHILAGIIKDIIPRYQTMKGKYVKRRWGWDCHGLPVEHEMEKELGFKSKKDVLEYGVDKFNEECRKIVLRYTAEWEKVIRHTGRWVDFKNQYRTMDLPYMESIWWVFRSLWDKGLIYEGEKIVPYCTRCATTLSNFEVNQGYVEITDPAITIKFQDEKDANLFYLAWTTTPWTLPSNLALAVGPDIDYLEVEDSKNHEHYVLAKQRLSAYYRSEEEYSLIREFKGAGLEGRRYVPLFDYFKDVGGSAFTIVLADYVSIDDGTGIVHTAPGFGEDDYQTGFKYGLPTIIPVDENGNFTSDVPDYEGVYVKAADKDIMEGLKHRNLVVKRESILHNYPHCWRCDSPLIYKGISTWFVKIDPIKERMIKSNDKINWIPDHIKSGRFGKWLEGARDWAISRNRFWGAPLPVWRCAECNETACIGSVSELEKLSGEKITDIHKHFVDKIEFDCKKCKGKMVRIPEVLDCWFESGSMPYAQEHYPFENKDIFEKQFPADFIAEGLDQTRGWFYTLTVIAAALFDSNVFKNCIVNGMVLAEDGKKMSKRLKNYPDPMYIMNTYGADAMRLSLINSPVLRGEDLRFSEHLVKDTVKNILLPLWNSYSFFVTYARVDGWKPPADIDDEIKKRKFSNELDRWILSLLQHLVNQLTESVEEYKLYKAVSPMVDFVDQLTNWYIRNSRRRFWKSDIDDDKDDAYTVLYYVLLTFSKIAAPFVPFITEEIFQNLRTDKMEESVHLETYPLPNDGKIDLTLERRMSMIEVAVKLGRALRMQNNLKVRQPLAKMHIINANEKELAIINDMAPLIMSELNVKGVEFSSDESSMVKLSAKPNFKKLGKEIGPNMKKYQAALSKLSTNDIVEIQQGKSKPVSYDGFSYEVAIDDIIICREEREGLKVLNEGRITVGLETELTDELIQEGNVRELVSKVQNMRKDADFNVVDRISTVIASDDKILNALKTHEEYFKSETLTSKLEMRVLEDKESPGVEWDINGHKAYILIEVM